MAQGIGCTMDIEDAGLVDIARRVMPAGGSGDVGIPAMIGRAPPS